VAAQVLCGLVSPTVRPWRQIADDTAMGCLPNSVRHINPDTRLLLMSSTVGYAAEVCPIRLRGYLTAYINMCWGIGILLSSGVVKALLTIQTDWSWRIPFVLQWIWLPPLFAISYFCPPSPWWMVRKGRIDDAKTAVRRLTNPALFSDAEVDDSVAYMIHTTEMEREVSEGTSYIECFKGTNRRRTEIAMMTFTMQVSHFATSIYLVLTGRS
jgi:SP family general alpha glucoside:H+ symporter-like MFS transporter